MSLITPDFGLLFWMAVVFLVVLGIFWKFGFPTIVKMVNERKEYIDESLRQAHEAREKMAKIQEESEAILREAREAKAQLVKEGTDTRNQIVADAQAAAREEGNRLIAEAKKNIDAEKAAAIREIKAQVAELSVKIAEKVVRHNIASDAEQMSLIGKLIDEAEKE